MNEPLKVLRGSEPSKELLNEQARNNLRSLKKLSIKGENFAQIAWNISTALVKISTAPRKKTVSPENRHPHEKKKGPPAYTGEGIIFYQ